MTKARGPTSKRKSAASRGPRSATSGEFALIEQLAARLSPRSARPFRGVELGIGDDAAVLRVGAGRLLVSVDDQVEGVHFDLAWLDLFDVGYRALQAAASDLAAMGARPLAAVASLHVPLGFAPRRLAALADGQALAGEELGCPIVGGNVARGPVLSITTTVLGQTRSPILRSGARPGDELWLLGEIGLARAGLLLHRRGRRVPSRLANAAVRARSAFARPRAQIRAGLSLRGRAHAAIDLSDGLAGDARHLAACSEVRVVIEHARLETAVPVGLAELGLWLGESASHLALAGGEDYALLAAGPRARRPRSAKVIGRIERGHGAWLELPTGRHEALGSSFDHLVSRAR